ncbi:hypothetical protein QTP88_023662 [Uroleucon formosanum]
MFYLFCQTRLEKSQITPVIFKGRFWRAIAHSVLFFFFQFRIKFFDIMLHQETFKKSTDRAQRIVAGDNYITAFTSLGLILLVVLFGSAAVCAMTLLLFILYTGLTMTVLIADVVRSPEVQFTLEKCFPGAVQKINSGLVSQSSSVILDFGRRAIATLVVGTWGAVQALGACMIVVVDLLGPSKYSILDAIQTMKYTVDKNDLTVERTRRISLEVLKGDPILWAAYAQGWEDRTEDTHLNIQAWNPSPTRPLTIVTLPAERPSLADEQTGRIITPEDKKLGLTTTSAQITAPPTRKPTGDQPINSKKRRSVARKMEFLANNRGKAIQLTGDGIGNQISIIVWSWPTLKKLPNTTMISYNEFLWANNLVQFDEATLQVSQLYRIVEIPRSVLPNASFDGFVYSDIQSLVNSKVQWEYLTCLFGETVHGAHITEDWARKLCLTHLKVNVNPDEVLLKLYTNIHAIH